MAARTPARTIASLSAGSTRIIVRTPRRLRGLRRTGRRAGYVLGGQAALVVEAQPEVVDGDEELAARAVVAAPRGFGGAGARSVGGPVSAGPAAGGDVLQQCPQAGGVLRGERCSPRGAAPSQAGGALPGGRRSQRRAAFSERSGALRDDRCSPGRPVLTDASGALQGGRCSPRRSALSGTAGALRGERHAPRRAVSSKVSSALDGRQRLPTRTVLTKATATPEGNGLRTADGAPRSERCSARRTVLLGADGVLHTADHAPHRGRCSPERTVLRTADDAPHNGR